MSFFLALVDVVDEVVAAEATFSLLDQDHKPVPSAPPARSTSPSSGCSATDSNTSSGAESWSNRSF
jgi:hypothetical protein